MAVCRLSFIRSSGMSRDLYWVTHSVSQVVMLPRIEPTQNLDPVGLRRGYNVI